MLCCCLSPSSLERPTAHKSTHTPRDLRDQHFSAARREDELFAPFDSMLEKLPKEVFLLILEGVEALVLTFVAQGLRV
jgi:hypothetical protein